MDLFAVVHKGFEERLASPRLLAPFERWRAKDRRASSARVRSGGAVSGCQRRWEEHAVDSLVGQALASMGVAE